MLLLSKNTRSEDGRSSNRGRERRRRQPTGAPFIMRRSRPRSVSWLTLFFLASPLVIVGYRFGSRGEDAVVMRGMCVSQHFPPHVISYVRTNSNTVRACSNAVQVLSGFRSKLIRVSFEEHSNSVRSSQCSPRYFMLQSG